MQAVNLLPNHQRPSAAPKGPAGRDFPVGAIAILGVLVVAVACLALHVRGKNTVKDREAELAAVTQQVQAVQARSSGLARYQAFEQLASTRAQTVGALARGRFEWSRTLTDIARVLPRDAYLNTICGDAGLGGCEDSLRSAIPNVTAVTLAGCTSSQDAVADLMTRLRDVRGVTRVTLGSSTSAGSSDSGSASSATSSAATKGGVTKLPCPKGDPPQFNLVVFFERDAIESAAQANGTTGTTATATATPTATTAGAPTATPSASATPTTTP